MSKDQIILLYRALPKLNNLIGAKFAYFVARNISLMRSEVEATEAALKPSEEFSKYEIKRVALAKAHAELDDKGEPKTKKNDQGQNEYIMKNMADWDKIFDDLKSKHKKVLDARQKQIDEYNELIKEKSHVKLFKIKMKEIPPMISVEQMSIIVDLIED